MTPLLSLVMRQEPDVVLARQRAKALADLVGLDRIEQTRLATAVSEIARNAVVYAGGGRVDYQIDGSTAPQLLVVHVSDRGPGIRNLAEILGGEYHSTSGLGLGLSGARRLVDHFHVDSSTSGTTIRLAKLLPPRSPLYDALAIERLARQLAAHAPASALAEIRYQNTELVQALEALQARQDELERVNRELEDTNRGVVALYAELDERADHLRRADDLKTKFLSNMTHEFRTPVNSILALSRLLAERLALDEHEKNELFYIRRSAEQLSDLVDDLLDIAKVEAGKIEVHPAHCEVAGLFGALRGMLRPLLAGQSVTLVFDAPDDLPPLYSDESKISQILRNFISNAIKYTEEGEVRVSASYLADEAMMRFDVADTGIGIPEADLPRIFDEFVQIENPLQRRTKGTGLGLPLSRRLSELLGGRVTVTSVLGAGSTFSLTVPLMHRAMTANAEAPALEVGQVPLLIVEDSPDDLLLYRRALVRSMFQIVVAPSADAARQLAASVRPAAIILDIRLHGREAWDLLIDWKRETATSAIPVVVISTMDDSRKAFGLGAHAFAVKPFDRVWLLRTLATLVPSGSPVRVLMVDDDEAFRFVLRESLAGTSYDVLEARSGQEALALAREFRPDILLLDLQLPDMSGRDLAAALAADPDTAHVPMLVVSSEPVSPGALTGLPIAGMLRKAALTRDGLRAAIRDAVLVSPTRPGLAGAG
jgi:signal transduction histidine kinase/DNA-binding response OmpR family regulator